MAVKAELWFVGHHLECSAKTMCWRKSNPLPVQEAGAKAGVWTLVSWLFGSFTHVTFSG